VALAVSNLSARFRLVLALIIAIAVFASISVYIATRSLFSPIDSISESITYEVSAGSGVIRVANDLHTLGLVDSPLLFRLLAEWQGNSANLQSGEYAIDPGMSAADILSAMVSGTQIQYRVTLVEGWTFAEALSAIQSADQVRQTLAPAIDQASLVTALDLEVASPEGMIFPDTYFYTKNTSDIEILRRANTRLQEVLQQAWDQRLGALPYASPYEALILASIIEKESGLGSERSEIAGVFVRRLEQGMRLQSDPTVIYGMGADFDGDLRREDLRQETTYNTYRINGLPPTPIALAGEDSIIASLHPAESDSLYFVARGDGSHYFSSTLEEHNAAVNRFQRQTNENQDN